MVFQPAAGIVVPQVFLKRYRIIPGNTEEKRFRILKNGIDQAANQKLLFPFADDTFGLVHLSLIHIYHFTWSCDDTGSENYHVNYGTAERLYGPVTYHYPVLEKRPDDGIMGTGHHCIMKEWGKDSYVVAYHRFALPLSAYPEGKGFHRETCIDKVEFDENGMMKKIVPSL